MYAGYGMRFSRERKLADKLPDGDDVAPDFSPLETTESTQEVELSGEKSANYGTI